MEEYSEESRKWFKKLGGADKVKKDYQNDQHAVIYIARLLKQITIDENAIQFKMSTKTSDMPNHTKKGHG